VIFRLGLASSRTQARQLVNHGHFLVNNKSVNIPSFSVKKGDKITIKPSSQKKNVFKDILAKLKKYQPPSWLSFDIKNLKAEVLAIPSLEEAAPPADVSAIFEFYSR
jgi:small subunit ribosomal protein S4